MSIITGIFAMFQSIPILDKWADRLLSSYRQWKHDLEQNKIDAAVEKTKTEDNTEDLQNELGKLT